MSAAKAKTEFGFALGLASYTFRAFGLDETLAMAKRLDLRKISLKSMHLPLESTPDRTRSVLAKVQAADLDLYAGGVIDIPKLMRTLVRLKYAGAVSLEYEKDEKDPLPGAAESIGYVRGVLAAL